ncbi:thiamine pyrophosphate-dependent enzyme [Streptomyces cyanogenus]|uniref:Acetolactate synthase isozyme 3 large subunit n=1 Tax=Streptomyces cyanogenus TaxID=80860 RepID=A0ABX7TVK9_STRCY|nr:thiamine pyrophosphate-dependent enzyme [Streptomyces cyanogenus]QTD99703.1 Acetolactate synthase isozyme 3 large subunit [Streptomyces cyanogenus]
MTDAEPVKTVAEHIAAHLVAEGVETVFTVPGEQIDPLIGAIAAAGIGIVPARHEQGAAFMAYGYARSTGRIGVHAVISGPGVLHSTAGLALGYAGDARMLCLAGQVPTAALGRGLGVPHEIPDQLGVLRTLTGRAERVTEPGRVATVLGAAFHHLAVERPRPVAVEIPADVLAARVSSPAPFAAPEADRTPDRAAVEAARELLCGARAPLVVVGSGARAAAAEVTALAERLQAPVTSEMGGRGIPGDDHDLALPYPAAHRLWPRVDVVLAVGTRFMRPQVEWGLDDRLKVIRVDLDAEEIKRVARPEVALVADAGEALRALLAELPAVTGREQWLAEARRARRGVEEELARLVPQIDFIRAMRGALPEDGFFVDELTQVGYTARVAFPALRPYTYVPATYQGGLGFGFATALGVQVANPGRAVLSVSGDGGFLYTANELATAVQHRIPVVAVVFNDNCYANIARSQRSLLGRTIATDLHNPDFVAYAESFGARGVRAEGPGELAAAVTEAFRRTDVPTVIEVPVGEMPSPWSLIRLPRVR